MQSAALVLPVADAKTGGDFHLVQSIGERTLAFVGDVAGNGEDAAPYADRVSQELQRNLDEPDPAMLLERLNSMIYHDGDFDRFVSACVISIDRPTWLAEWAFAGHIPPHWLDTGVPLDGATPGLPLGVEERCGSRSAHRKPLRPAEGMLLFTDGLEDVVGPGGDRFGIARVTHALARAPYGAPPEEVVTTLRDLACSFGDRRLADDMCLVALRVS